MEEIWRSVDYTREWNKNTTQKKKELTEHVVVYANLVREVELLLFGAQVQFQQLLSRVIHLRLTDE